MENSIDLYRAIQLLPDLLDKYPAEFMPLAIRLATYLIDQYNEEFQKRRTRLSQAAPNLITEDNNSQEESIEDSDWPLEDSSHIWYSESKNDDKEKIITIIRDTVKRWIKEQEIEKVKLAIKLLYRRKLAIFPTVLIHCLRQEPVKWKKELLDILSNEVLYRRRSCWYEVGEALKSVLPHATDKWIDSWISTVESALPHNGEKIARLVFFACCPEKHLPKRIRDEISDVRSQNISLENKPLFGGVEWFSRDAFEADLETIDSAEVHEILRILRELYSKSLNNSLNESDAKTGNQLVSKILKGDFELKRKDTNNTEPKIHEEIDFIDPYNMALSLSVHLIRDKQANEEVKQLAEQLAWESLSEEIPSYYQEEPAPDKYKGIPSDRFSNSIAVLGNIIKYQPTNERCDKYLELINHKNGDIRWMALWYLPIPKDKLEWYCEILKERAKIEWLNCCLHFICRNLCRLSQFPETEHFAIKTIELLLNRLSTDSNIQTPNESFKQLAEFFGSAISMPGCPKEFNGWALNCAQSQFGNDALMSSVSGTKNGLVTRINKNMEVDWYRVRKIYKTAITHINDSQDLTQVTLWIAHPLEDIRHSEMFEELLPVLKDLAARANDKMLFNFSRYFKNHLQKHPVECLEIFDIVTSQELTGDTDRSGLGIQDTAEVLQELDAFVPKAHRERLRECIERLAKIGNSTAQKHLLKFV